MADFLHGIEHINVTSDTVPSSARAAGDSKTVATIEALGAPPWTDPRSFGILRRATRAYEAKTSTPPDRRSPGFTPGEHSSALVFVDFGEFGINHILFLWRFGLG